MKYTPLPEPDDEESMTYEVPPPIVAQDLRPFPDRATEAIDYLARRVDHLERLVHKLLNPVVIALFILALTAIPAQAGGSGITPPVLRHRVCHRHTPTAIYHCHIYR